MKRTTKKGTYLRSRSRERVIKAPKGWRVVGAGIGAKNDYVRITYSQPIKRESKKKKGKK